LRAVVDTNVIAYYILQTEGLVDEARSFWAKVTAPIAPASWIPELANTVWLNIQQGGLDLEVGLQRLRLTEKLGIVSVDPTQFWEAAIRRSSRTNHPAYDTLFVELAARESVPLATFDKRILAKFPEIAKRPRDLVG
jgi:predicted nucleic acid-binding protein